jgi:hypothetical protein
MLDQGLDVLRDIFFRRNTLLYISPSTFFVTDVAHLDVVLFAIATPAVLALIGSHATWAKISMWYMLDLGFMGWLDVLLLAMRHKQQGTEAVEECLGCEDGGIVRMMMRCRSD